MKRVMNNVALGTVLSVIGGLQEIEVYDRENDYVEPVLVYKGMVKDFISIHTVFPKGYSEYKVNASMVHRIDVKENVIVFTLRTKYEEY